MTEEVTREEIEAATKAVMAIPCNNPSVMSLQQGTIGTTLCRELVEKIVKVALAVSQPRPTEPATNPQAQELRQLIGDAIVEGDTCKRLTLDDVARIQRLVLAVVSDQPRHSQLRLMFAHYLATLSGETPAYRHYKRADEMIAMIPAPEALSRPAADRGQPIFTEKQIEAALHSGEKVTDALNTLRAANLAPYYEKRLEFAKAEIAQLRADREQIVEECARVAERYNDGTGFATARGIAAAIRALSPAPAQTEE